MVEETKKIYRQVIIQEYYKKENGQVYRYWKFINDQEYRRELTAFPDLPWFEVNFKNGNEND